MKIIIDDFFITISQKLNFDSIGKIFKNLLHNDQNKLNQEEEFLFNYISNLNKEKRQKRQNAVNKRWQKIKEQKEAQQSEQTQAEISKKEIEETEQPKTQKIPNILPISQTNKKNIYQQTITQNIQQKNKVDNFNYLKKGVLRI